jgi:hypothetical protein
MQLRTEHDTFGRVGVHALPITLNRRQLLGLGLSYSIHPFQFISKQESLGEPHIREVSNPSVP